MPLSLYEISIPVFIRGLNNLSHVLKMGQTYAADKGIDESTLVQTKLHETMFGLIFQVQRVTDTAKGAAVRIGRVENIVVPDKEKTFDELQARVQTVIDFLKTVKPSDMDDKQDSEAVLPLESGDVKFTGSSYILVYALPNFFFHITTTYSILRHMGVPLGKFDYIGGAPKS